MNVEKQISVSSDDTPDRLDIFVSDHLKGLSRSRIQFLIKEGYITVNGESAKSSYIVKADDHITIFEFPEQAPAAVPEDIDLDIVYEDSDLIVINKKSGMVVHPSPGHSSGTLVNALLYKCSDISKVGNLLRPGIVHRLDKDTTGLIVVAKNDPTHAALSDEFRERRVVKNYLAIAGGEWGVSDMPGKIFKISNFLARDRIDRKRFRVVREARGKYAESIFTLLYRGELFSLVKADIKTGRTHQIRVQLSHIRHPIAGDSIYGWHKLNNAMKDLLTGESQEKFLGLCSYRLSFRHPGTGEVMDLRIEPPEYFKLFLEKAGIIVEDYSTI